jgi:hypothetical protein
MMWQDVVMAGKKGGDYAIFGAGMATVARQPETQRNMPRRFSGCLCDALRQPENLARILL